jgi:hypothetical protein
VEDGARGQEAAPRPLSQEGTPPRVAPGPLLGPASLGEVEGYIERKIYGEPPLDLAMQGPRGMSYSHRVPTPAPLPLREGRQGRNHLNEEIIPLLLSGIGEQYSQTISNLEHAALSRRCELPL